MATNPTQNVNRQPNSTGFLPPPSGYYGGRPIQFGFFDGVPMDVNMHSAWEGSDSSLLHNGFVQRFRTDGSSVMVPFDQSSAPTAEIPLDQMPTRSKDTEVNIGPEVHAQDSSGAQESCNRSQPTKDDEDVISISSIEDAGAKHAPGDSAYRGRASRVKVEGEFSRPNTRRQTAAAKKKGPSQSGSQDQGSSHDSSGASVTPNEQSSTGKTTTRRGRRVVKSAPVVVSSDDDNAEDHAPNEPPFTQPRLQPSPMPKPKASKKDRKGKGSGKRCRRSRQDVSSGADDPRPSKRQTVMDTIDISDSESLPDLASMLGELVKRNKNTKGSKKDMIDKVNGLFRSSKRWRNAFLDLEAVENNDSASSSGAMDGYDTSDSFIDDSALKNNAHAPVPGLEFEDFAREAQAKKDKQIEEDRYMAQAMTRHAAMADCATSSSRQQRHEGATRSKTSIPTTSNGGQTTADADKGFADDEFGVDFYRAQFEEAIRRSRARSDRAPSTTGQVTGHPAAGPSAGPSPPRYQLGYRGPPPAYTPNPQYIAQMVTPPDSSRPNPVSAPGPLPPPPESPSAPGMSSRRPRTTGSSAPHRGQENPTNPQHDGSQGNSSSIRFTWPDECEVNDPTLHDPLLTGDYADLVKLRRGTFVPWSNAPGKGLVRFSAWKDQAPDMDPTRAFQAIRFQRHQEFINPSRASPAELDVKDINGGLHSQSLRLHAYLDGQPAICVSAIYSELSFLRTLTQFGLPQNMLQGKLHTQEFDRLVGFFCMAFGIPELHANLARDSMHFVTRPVSRDASSGSAQAPGMFSKNSSPSTKRTVSNRLLVDHFALDSRNDVPIYDATSVPDFNFEADLPTMDSRLPLLVGEVPFGSFAYVGYTTSVYRAANGNWTLSCNIRWVIVLGIPPLTRA